MNAKHQFKYTYNEGCEEFSPVEVTFDMPGDVTITQMLWNFECYLKSCGFVFDGHLEVVPEFGYDLKDLEDQINEEPPYCCMGDSDCCEESEEYKAEKLKEWNEGITRLDNEQKKKANEDARKMSDLHYEATKEVVKKNKYNDYSSNNVSVKTDKDMWNKVAETVKQKWVHGICNPPSPDWKKSDSDNCWNS
jgi:hypothetical protein